MNKKTEHDTREHLLATGEQLSLQLGFTGMGLSELLRTAGVPKGSFYHYFPSKGAFGVEMLKRYYAASWQRQNEHFMRRDVSARELLLGWYRIILNKFCDSGMMCDCLSVKLSAEVCDLSEEMRGALDCGSGKVIALLEGALKRGRDDDGSLTFSGDTHACAQALYALWLGASLQAKISRSAVPLESALALVENMLITPAS